jgi:hypothetical protein
LLSLLRVDVGRSVGLVLYFPPFFDELLEVAGSYLAQRSTPLSSGMLPPMKTVPTSSLGKDAIRPFDT